VDEIQYWSDLVRLQQLISRAIILCLVFCIGCDTERLDQFSKFSTAGTQYVLAFHSLTNQAGSAMIAVDSATLVIAHKDVLPDLTKDPNKYATYILDHDSQLQIYLANLKLLDEHATKLGSYFDAISNLTNGKAASGTTAAATDLLNSIDQLNPKVGSATFLGKTVQDYVKSGTPFIVAHFEVKALDDQLEKAKPIIQKALELQQAAVEAIAAQMKAALVDTLKIRESTDVVDPYLQQQIPSSWNANREAYLRAQVTLSSLDSAQAAISQLNVAFKQLVENKNASIDLTSLLNAISKMTGYVSSVETSAKTPTK
jgi:hypothetical protein